MLPILKFSPVLLPKPWGGDGLWRLLRKGGSGDARMGEAWELSDRAGAATPVSEGPFAGRTLTELLMDHAPDLLGASPGSPVLVRDFSAKAAFPLLYKFIAAREKLSVQVHPGAGSPLGDAKTECWYVVDAEPGAALIVGVAPEGKTRDEVLARLKSPDCEGVLQRLPARKGDVFFIPAGTVHAITEGLLLYEVQQNSDTTFRLYDWGRTDVEGRPRPLHIEEAGQVADTEARAGYRIPPLLVERVTHAETFLVACPWFALVKWHAFAGTAHLSTHGRFRVVTVTAGALILRGDDGAGIRLGLGETALVPACLAQVALEAETPEAEAIVSFVPDPDADVREPLAAAGHASAAIEALFGPPGIRL
jgi:mannose-6-phosphate isomerase